MPYEDVWHPRHHDEMNEIDRSEILSSLDPQRRYRPSSRVMGQIMADRRQIKKVAFMKARAAAKLAALQRLRVMRAQNR